MKKALYIEVDKKCSIVEVETNADVRNLLNADIGDLDTIYLSDDILLFYNFNKIEEIGHMTGRVTDKDGNSNFVCGDLIAVRINGFELSSITDEDVTFIKSLLGI